MESPSGVDVWLDRQRSFRKTAFQLIIPASYHESHNQGLKRFLATNESRVLNQQLELTAVHRNGREIPVKICISAIQFENEYTFTGVVCDITEHNNAIKQARLREEEYKVLHEVAKALQNSVTMEEMLRDAMEAISQSRGLHVKNKAGVFLADEKKKVLRLTATLGTFAAGFLDHQTEIPYYNIPYGRCFTTGEMVINDWCLFHPHQPGPFGDMTTYGSYIIPLKSRKEVVGVLFLYTPETPPCYEGSKEILQSIGSLIGNAIKQRQFEKKIQLKNEELKDLNILKNKFLSIASHDLRNPLYTILAYSQNLTEEAPDELNERQRKALNKITQCGEFMGDLLDNLLDISKIESGKFSLEKTSGNINAIAECQFEMNQLMANRKNIQLYFEGGVCPILMVDKGAITQVMNNFVGNAIKFSPQNSKIRIKTEMINNYFRYSVSDEGPGISKEDQKLAFGEFQTLNGKPTGGEKSTGLGLAIPKKLIHLHGGQVGIISELEKGSTFYFELPVK